MNPFQSNVEDGGEQLSLVPQLEEPGSGHPLHALYLSDALRARLLSEGLTDEVGRVSTKSDRGRTIKDLKRCEGH